MHYKEPKTPDEQLTYLHDHKRVIYKRITADDAKEILYDYNYINVISPFKRVFAQKDHDGYPIKINGCHIYDRDVDFMEYYECYRGERDRYPLMYTNLLKFETNFNAILSCEVIHYYCINSSEQFKLFQDNLKSNILQSNYNQSTKDHMLDELEKFDYQMSKFESIYIFMDRLSLSSLIMVFRACDENLKKKIFNSMCKRGFTLGYVDLPTFDDDCLKRIVSIRNCICHGNSLNILIIYHNIKTKHFRNDSDRKKYITIIKRLQSS